MTELGRGTYEEWQARQASLLRQQGVGDRSIPSPHPHIADRSPPAEPPDGGLLNARGHPVTNGHQPAGTWRDRLRISTGDQLADADPGPIATLPLLGQDGYVPVGFTIALSAYPKVGKTSLLAQLVHEWLALGHRVLVLSEESELLWQYRLAGHGWDGLLVIHAAGADLRDLRGAIDEEAYDVVIVDTVRSILQLEDETDNSKVRAAVEPWVLAVRDRRKTGVFATHETKAGGSHGRGMAGGHALLGVVDGLLSLDRGRKPDHRVLRPLHRLPAQHVETRELVYAMNAAGRLWCVTKINEDPDRHAREALVDYVRDHPGCGAADARKAVGGNAKQADKIIEHVIERGLIENRGSDEPRQPRAYYLVDDPIPPPVQPPL